MDYGKRNEMMYRMIFIGAWAAHIPPKTQNQRELGIATHKLQRLAEQDAFHFMTRIESNKRVEKLEQKNARTIGLQYERIVKLVGKCIQDIQKRAGKQPLTSSELNEKMYGENGFLTEAVKYGEQHATK
jgi:hypothetical protein